MWERCNSYSGSNLTGDSGTRCDHLPSAQEESNGTSLRASTPEDLDGCGSGVASSFRVEVGSQLYSFSGMASSQPATTTGGCNVPRGSLLNLIPDLRPGVSRIHLF
ncbi:hypothetical protein Nepgr_029041 [Nepenthes gracilis]|uniref:Uncharacterized protein n=1 Tax=Nepenthes gracilis TaxID=150966 RepID=A0AAD3TBT5_NEPGR|nr:hypothetical protein Nepgr_029041 [Nepenthes gracilis]